MDKHCLEKLNFDKIKESLSEYAFSELGKEKVKNLTPSVNF